MTGDDLKLGLLLPQEGPIGMWGLSCENCTQMAIAEINSAGGILGRKISYSMVNASGDPAAVAAATAHLVENNDVDAIIGMHTSDIRVAVAKSVQSRVPFIFTPMYEGGEETQGVYLIGQTPENQIKPMVAWMMSHLGINNWCMIGNRYNYPYVSNQIAKREIQENGGTVVDEVYVPMDQSDFLEEIKKIREIGPDGVFVNLIGDSCVAFNRAFGRAGLSDQIVRFCGVLEENTLLGIGARNTRGIYSATGYFQDLETSDAQNFLRLYEHFFGQKSPLLNQFAVSCYEGVTLLSALAQSCGSLDVDALSEVKEGEIGIYGPRGQLPIFDRHIQSPTFVVEANGLEFKYVDQIAG